MMHTLHLAEEQVSLKMAMNELCLRENAEKLWEDRKREKDEIQ